MAASDAHRLVDLKPGDEVEAMTLSVEAGWNQVREDWLHFIVHGSAIGFRNGDGELVATAAALPYDGPFGFIGMVIVTAASRRQGLATTLVDHCVKSLQDAGRIPSLDATEYGEPVYRRQGFVPQFRYDRWEIDAAPDSDPGKDNPAITQSGVAEIDQEAFGARREALFADFLARPDTRLQTGDDNAFALLRRGRRAFAAGPVVAGSEEQALQLVRHCLPAGQPLFIDVPKRWKSIGKWLEQQGFAIQRSFARMALGRREAFGNPEHLFAMAGPEFG